MINFIVTPASAWRAPVESPRNLVPPRLDKLDLALIEALRNEGRYGSLVWPLLNKVAADQGPQRRTEARQFRLELWQRLNRLIKADLVHRYCRRHISIKELPGMWRSRRRHRASARVVKSPTVNQPA